MCDGGWMAERDRVPPDRWRTCVSNMSLLVAALVYAAIHNGSYRQGYMSIFPCAARSRAVS